MKEKIFELRNQGKTYREIQDILNCSRGLISYYLNPDGKRKNLDRQNRNRFVRKYKYKKLLGGKCSKCGYDKCMDALQFHHINPEDKKFSISDSVWGRERVKESEILEEIKKCILVCANCHCEIHSNNHSN